MNNEKEFEFLNDKKSTKKEGFFDYIYYFLSGILTVLYFIVNGFCKIIETIFILDTIAYAVTPKKKKRKKGWF